MHIHTHTHKHTHTHHLPAALAASVDLSFEIVGNRLQHLQQPRLNSIRQHTSAYVSIRQSFEIGGNSSSTCSSRVCTRHIAV